MSELQREIRELRAQVIALPLTDRRRSDAKHATTDALTAVTFAERRLQDAKTVMGTDSFGTSVEVVSEGGVIVREPKVVSEETQRLTIEWL